MSEVNGSSPLHLTPPPIYVRNAREPAAPGTRSVALVVALGCLAVMIVAAMLPPSHEGLATHRLLGLRECAFLATTGIPCPSCGMTTSFAWFARGNLVASFYVQPMGAVLALLCCCCIWAGFYIAITGRPIHRLLRLVPGRYTLWSLLGLGLAAWAWKIYLHLSGHDGW